MKTLIIAIHPNIETSVVSKRWIEELNKYPDLYRVHQLYKVYPDEQLDVEAEQKLVEKFDKIVFQFPFYWFNCPSFFKKWLDEVVLPGWAFGRESEFGLAGKKITMAISTGIAEHDYQPSGKYGITVEELIRPFKLSFDYIRAEYRPPFVYFGIDDHSSADWIEKSVPKYLEFLKTL